MDEQSWRQYRDPRGLFRIEIPASWRVQWDEGRLTHAQQGRIWEGERSITSLHPPAGRSASEERQLGMSIRIERYAETPPILKGPVEPTDIGFFRSYRITHDADWLSCVVGHLRVHISYEIQGLSHAYRPAGWEPHPPLSPDERHERLLLVRRVIHSFELLTSQ